ncbi:MAG TPA: glycoside hydrolase family 15 protein [Bacillota bacterium]|nr:glycoside hydrolase family 15 protein [Bacillota bacterium]
MPRDLIFGNGQLLVTCDRTLALRDLYYPYVGLWNHIGGHRFRLGLWVDGTFSWLGSGDWQIAPRYCESSLVGDSTVESASLGLRLRVSDAVHYRQNIFLRRVAVSNLLPRPRQVRLFFHQDFSIDESDVGDTAVYDPAPNVVYHYKRDRYFMVDGGSAQGGIAEFATGVKRFGGAEGTWRDAEDGHLEGNPISQGSVDSTVGMRLLLPPEGREAVWYWIAAGRTYGQALRLVHLVRATGPEVMLGQIKAYWQQWVKKAPLQFADLPDSVQQLYQRSLPILRVHVDRSGGITAANDSDILQYNRDHYSYVWPRDGALIALALTRAGYPELAAPFFSFCARALTSGGFLLQKYNPDGSAGSCWHPWVQDGRRQLPIQEDQTALVLHALWAHFQEAHDIELVLSLESSLIAPAAEFLAGYVYPELSLPRESYDLWEERRGVHTWTCATVAAGLQAAGNLVQVLGDEARAQRYWQAARRMRAGIVAHLYDPDLGRFVRGLRVEADGSVTRDPVPDASTAAIALFGVLPAADPRVVATMRHLEEQLWVKTEVGGLARYAGDNYFRCTADYRQVPGNAWFVTTLWLAEWYAAAARTRDDLVRARELITWAAEHAMPSGVMSEQIHPETGEPLSVAPLCWSHAALVHAVNRYVSRAARLSEPVTATDYAAADADL